MLALTQRFIPVAKRDAIGRIGCIARAISAIASSAQVAPSTSVKRKIQPLGLEPAPEFLDDAGLSHAPLPGQQHVVAVADLLFQYPQLAIAIEKVAAAYPTAGG